MKPVKNGVIQWTIVIVATNRKKTFVGARFAHKTPASIVWKASPRSINWIEMYAKPVVKDKNNPVTNERTDSMENINAFASELAALCAKHKVRIEDRMDYEYDGETNEYTHVEHMIAIVDVENGFSHKFQSVIPLPIGQTDET